MRGPAIRRRPRLHVGRAGRRLRLWLAVFPAVLAVALLVGWPALQVVWLSGFEVALADIAGGIRGPATWANYAAVLADPVVHRMALVTAIYVVATTAAAFAVGLAAALALDGAFRGSGAVRALVLSPWAVAPVIASLTWMFLLDRQYGVVNYVLLQVGAIASPVGWLATPDAALASLVLVSVWKTFPFFAVMLLAGLQAVPPVLYEAARIDGAGRLRRFRDVTWPGLRPVAAVAALFSALSAFREVETVLVLTRGGPARTTETLAAQVYVEAFQYLDIGQSAALGTMGLAAVLALAVLVLAARRGQAVPR